MKQEISEFRQFLKKMLWGVVAVVILGMFFMTYPHGESAVEYLFYGASETLLPASVRVVALSPLDAFASEITISLLLGLLILFPWFAYVLVSYFSPALTEAERRYSGIVSVPAAMLFVLGTVFSYIYVLPPTFSILYRFAGELGVEPLLPITDFVSTVLMLSLSCGLVFELPVAMISLNRLGLVDKSVWKHYFRHAIIVFLVFFAFITPDGSGLTMLILTLPMVLLYGAGWVFSRRY